jgi:AraC-like DNA-binding protein
LKKHDGIRAKLEPPRGVLDLPIDRSLPGYGRFWPAADVAPFVEHFWTVEWDLCEPAVREVLPHPSVHLVLESGSSQVAGVLTGKFTRRLAGKGRVLGTKFRPGGFHPFCAGPVSALTDRTLALGEVFGAAADDLEARALAEAEPIAAFSVVQTFLRRLLPAPDPIVELIGRIAARAATDREMTRVDHLVREFGIGARKLQRLFEEYVGVSPKWIIQRYRLHEAAERIARGATIDWATLALDLGYADQAHFIRDFKALVGRPPAAYAKALRRAKPTAG